MVLSLRLLEGALTLHDLWRLYWRLLLLLAAVLTFVPLLLLYLRLLLRTFLTVTADFVLQSPLFSSALHP